MVAKKSETTLVQQDCASSEHQAHRQLLKEGKL